MRRSMRVFARLTLLFVLFAGFFADIDASEIALHKAYMRVALARMMLNDTKKKPEGRIKDAFKAAGKKVMGIFKKISPALKSARSFLKNWDWSKKIDIGALTEESRNLVIKFSRDGLKHLEDYEVIALEGILKGAKSLGSNVALGIVDRLTEPLVDASYRFIEDHYAYNQPTAKDIAVDVAKFLIYATAVGLAGPAAAGIGGIAMLASL